MASSMNIMAEKGGWDIRKIEDKGGSKYVSIPKSWIDELGIEKHVVVIKDKENKEVRIKPIDAKKILS